jgi:hypothetical protein
MARNNSRNLRSHCHHCSRTPLVSFFWTNDEGDLIQSRLCSEHYETSVFCREDKHEGTFHSTECRYVLKAIKPSQAVIDFNKVEQSFQRAYRSDMPKASREWWLLYYARRLNEISTLYKIEPDDLLLEWMRWRTQSSQA